MTRMDRDVVGHATDASLVVALNALAAGGQVLVSGSLIGPFLMMSASAVSPDDINLMATEARGLVSLAMTAQRAAELGLSLQQRRGHRGAPLYTQSIEARHGVATGISAEDRALTIRAAISAEADAIVTPGHVFPHLPEGKPLAIADLSLRLLSLANQIPAAVTCVILDDCGEIANSAYANALAARLNIPLIAAKAVI